MTCEYESQLHAYHDDELDASSRAAFENHLGRCAACAASLAELQNISALFAATPREHLSQIAKHRLSNQIDASMERGLVRFAWSLSGVAAAVLLCGSFWLSQVKSREVTHVAPPWVEAVVSSHNLSDSAATPAAQWYLADASSRNEDVP